LTKLFNKILSNRLEKFFETNNIIKKEQIGLMKKSRTSDHMFILRTLIDKTKMIGRSKLFCCFVDFRKAFDTVVHPALFLKLNDLGVNGLFYKTLKNMYDNSVLNITIENTLSPEFISNIGVRQGVTLSPTFLKPLLTICLKFLMIPDPATLSDINLNSLMFADDAVLLSTSEKGLQNCLHKLEKYCDNWCLYTNVEKTKVLIFNKNGKLYKTPFLFQNKIIDCVQSYRYLGIIFTTSGTFTPAKNDLYQRALKCLFKLRKSFSDISPNIKTCLHIFDHTLKPILLYGSEIWGAHTLPNSNKDFKLETTMEEFPCEKLNIKFSKFILGVHKK
jgi:hypothetical protein